MMDTTDSSSTSNSCSPTPSSLSTTQSSSTTTSQQVQSSLVVHTAGTGVIIPGLNRVTKMSLERRSSNPGESGHHGHGSTINQSAAVLMMRRRVSSNNSWSCDSNGFITSNTNNNNNNNNTNVTNNNNYNNGVRSQHSNMHIPGTPTATTIRKEREQRLFPNHPVSTLVDDALMQMNLKRSSSAPMINQIGIQKEPADRFGQSVSSGIGIGSASTSATSSSGNEGSSSRETSMEIDVTSFTTSFLASLNNPRPRRFSASFCPGSPGPAPNRVSQLRHESTTDWEAVGEKEFLGTVNMAQSWEDLSLDPMEIGSRRPSISDQLWLSMPPGSSSASSSPAVSPRVMSRFSPSLSSPSPTRKSFTTRRSLSPIAVRPSVLSIGHGVKRKCDWDSSSSSSNNQMDTSSSPQPAPKKMGGLLGLSHGLSSSNHRSSNNSSPTYITSHFTTGSHHQPFQHLLPHRESPNSLETGTESSVSSVSGGGGDSPFFRPLESPMNSPSNSSDSPRSYRKT